MYIYLHHISSIWIINPCLTLFPSWISLNVIIGTCSILKMEYLRLIKHSSDKIMGILMIVYLHLACCKVKIFFNFRAMMLIKVFLTSNNSLMRNSIIIALMIIYLNNSIGWVKQTSHILINNLKMDSLMLYQMEVFQLRKWMIRFSVII
jgi:hypothetical protein